MHKLVKITQIIYCRGYHENELQTHIEILHEYNDIKDTAQRLIGLLGIQFDQCVVLD